MWYATGLERVMGVASSWLDHLALALAAIAGLGWAYGWSSDNLVLQALATLMMLVAAAIFFRDRLSNLMHRHLHSPAGRHGITGLPPRRP